MKFGKVTLRDIDKDENTRFSILKGQLSSYKRGEHNVQLRSDADCEFVSVDNVVLGMRLNNIVLRDNKLTYVFKEQEQ